MAYSTKHALSDVGRWEPFIRNTSCAEWSYGNWGGKKNKLHNVPHHHRPTDDDLVPFALYIDTSFKLKGYAPADAALARLKDGYREGTFAIFSGYFNFLMVRISCIPWEDSVWFRWPWWFWLITLRFGSAFRDCRRRLFILLVFLSFDYGLKSAFKEAPVSLKRIVQSWSTKVLSPSRRPRSMNF